MGNSKFKKETLLVSLIVATSLCVTLFAINLVGLHDGWPAFLVLLFFFETGAKKEKLKSIFSGGVVGLIFALGLFKGVEFLAPSLGMEAAIFTMVFVAVFLLVALGDISHTLFNNYAFCYFTVALIYQQQSTLQWLLVLLGGGIFLISIVSFFLKTIHKPKHTSKA